MRDVVVYDGNFWVDVEGILSRERRGHVMKDAEQSDSLILVDGRLWAKLVSPVPTKRQRQFFRAPWNSESIESQLRQKSIPSLK